MAGFWSGVLLVTIVGVGLSQWLAASHERTKKVTGISPIAAPAAAAAHRESLGYPASTQPSQPQVCAVQGTSCPSQLAHRPG
jgi:hypothetical protein